MGLNCITTYKLDALKAVRQRSESNDMHAASFVAQEGLDKDSTGNADCMLLIIVHFVFFWFKIVVAI